MEELDKVWLITGICGQDGSWMADILLEKGYKNVHGIKRRSASFNTKNIEHIFDKLKLHYGDLTDFANINRIIAQVRPDYIVNLAAQSHVKVSHDLENYTINVNTIGILNILQSVRGLGLKCKIYHASTSEMYGNTTDGKELLTETSPMHPVSIYGIAKLAAHQICNMYRDAYGMFIVSSILFNHEGSRRGHTFVTQKIAKYIADYYKTSDKTSFKPLQIGNLNARRDWGDAKDYMNAVYLMLLSDKPDNYVIATGETHSVREFIELAFNQVGTKIEWKGDGLDEVGVDSTGQTLVQVNPHYFRDIDIECLIGDATNAREKLGWTPSVTFNNLVKYMVKEAIKN